MKKNLLINKNSEGFIVLEDNNKICEVKNTDLLLSGRDLFFNLFDKFPINETVDLDIYIDKSIKDSNDKRIANEIKQVLIDICNKIEEKKKCHILNN